MQSPLLLLIAAYLLQICCGFLSSITSHWRVGILPLKDTVWPSVDISPEKNGKLIKRVIRKGDFTKGKPTTQDCVTISWQIRSREGKLLHDSDMLPSDEKTFSFTLGQGKSEVIEGWDIAVADMYEGETAAFNISTDLAFGEQGLPPYIEPHSDICCDLTLIQITPSIDRSFKRIAPDEDIQDELMEKLMSGHIPLPSKDNDGIPSAPPDKPPSSARIFDPSKHNLNPKQKVAGEGRGHNWEESFRNIEIEIPLPSSVSGKADLIVRIRYVASFYKLFIPSAHFRTP